MHLPLLDGRLSFSILTAPLLAVDFLYIELRGKLNGTNSAICVKIGNGKLIGWYISV